jgi:hypothetical protein
VEKLWAKVNDIRDDPDTFATDHLAQSYAKKVMKTFDGPIYGDYRWNENLAMAGRHLLHESGTCAGIPGTVYGDTLPDLLKKYYTLDYEDLEVLRIDSKEYYDNFLESSSGDNDEMNIFDFIFSQDCISKEVFFKKEARDFAIACSCQSIETPYSVGNQGIGCYFITARNIVNKKIIENIPAYVSDLTSSCSCDIIENESTQAFKLGD